MTTFDSTKRSLPKLLQDITTGKTQLPDFQRGWVWDDSYLAQKQDPGFVMIGNRKLIAHRTSRQH